MRGGNCDLRCPSYCQAAAHHRSGSTSRPSTLPSRWRESFHSGSALSPTAQAAKRTRSAGAEKGRTDRLARAEQAKNKVTGGAPAKKKQAGPTTLDTLLDDVENKMSLIPGMSRPEVCKKMAEAIAADASLAEADRKKLTELVNGLAEDS